MRTRIVAMVAVLVTAALAGAGLLVHVVESQRIEQQTVEEVDQELDEFAVLLADGTDPGTGLPFASVDDLLRLFLGRNVPDDDELLVGWVGDRPTLRFPQDDTLYRDPRFLEATAPLVAAGGSTRITTPDGETLVTTQPVQLGDESGALVVVKYLREDRAELFDTMRTYSVVALLALLIVVAVAAWQSGRLLAPLRVLRDTAEEMGETDLSRRIPLTGNDDITALTRTVNGMLDRLEEAFVGQRQFLDDAGHELRTPLTVLRGHLELLDVGSPDDVTETKDLLLEETDRMGRLVGDLILLAKRDRPDFVTLRPVELAGLTTDVLAKARGLGERHWVLDDTAELRVLLDEQRITQALLQLCDNAVKHTEPGAEIAIGSAAVDDRAELWVRDTGPGVPAADRELVFARFGRSRVAEGSDGFGLGLSIVDAIVNAHGGRVHVEDARPRGACFVISLPARTAPTAPDDPGRPDRAHRPDVADHADVDTRPISLTADTREDSTWPRS